MRIAIYTRVSTDKLEQKSSLKHQKEYLQSLYPDDEITIFYDEGITATSIGKREGFQQMLLDCGLKKVYTTKKKFVFEVNEFVDSKFDRIITKSVSRFARNVEIVSIWRLLEQKGVSIYFQDINKDTASPEDSLILKLSLALSEEESKNIAERTKWGNKASANANKIKNNELYGYNFDRENNSLTIIEHEAENVRRMFDLCIQGLGYRVICSTLEAEGVQNRKGQPFTTATVKNMLHNKKYCGFNVRNQWQSVGLFTENHTYKRTKKDDWIVQKNDRIEPIISEEIFLKAHEQINKRLLHGNRGKNISKKDTRGKIVCGYCGKSFYICHSKTIGSAINSNPYYICATKKNKGKDSCNAENISQKKLDEYIETARKSYFTTIKVKNRLTIKKLEAKLKQLNNSTKEELLLYKKEIKEQMDQEQSKINSLLDTFLVASETLKKAIEGKINTIEEEVKRLEEEANKVEELLTNKETEKKKILYQIKQLKKELEEEKEELSRDEFMERIHMIKVFSKDKIETVWTA